MPAPDHATIARFRILHFAPCAKVIMSRLNRILADNGGELSLRHIFIDGTKIEAAANKYTFVWRKAVTRNQQKLAARVPELFQEAEQLFQDG